MTNINPVKNRVTRALNDPQSLLNIPMVSISEMEELSLTALVMLNIVAMIVASGIVCMMMYQKQNVLYPTCVENNHQE